MMNHTMVANNSIKADSKAKSPDAVKYQTIFWLFVIGSVIGFVLEGLWSIWKVGHWEHHSSAIWGPFCIIYGIGAVAAYLISLLFSGKNILLQFAVCSLSGGLVEYFGSLFQEVFLGSVSWNYSAHSINIGGRVSLKMALLWGVLGVAFMRFLFPLLKRAFQKLNGKKGALLCGLATVFMVVNLAATCLVVTRWQERLNDAPPGNRMEQVIDSIYDNEKMDWMFPNMQFVGSGRQ